MTDAIAAAGEIAKATGSGGLSIILDIAALLSAIVQPIVLLVIGKHAIESNQGPLGWSLPMDIAVIAQLGARLSTAGLRSARSRISRISLGNHTEYSSC